MEKKIKIITGIASVIGIVLIIIAVCLFIKTKNFQAKAVLAEGVVTELREMSNTTNQPGQIRAFTYAPVIKYTSKEGQEYTYYSNTSANPPAYSVGEKVQIYYDPANPADAGLAGVNSMLGTIICGGIGLVFIFLGGIIFWLNAKGGGDKALMQNGRKISADIMEVGLNTSFEMNGKNPFKIHCQWLNPSDNTVYEFNSKNIWFDPSHYMNDRKKIDVYIDFNNPKKYFMDISFLPKNA